MSYNIDSIEIVARDGFRLSYEALVRLDRDISEDNRAESNFIEEAECAAPGEWWEPKRIDWQGEWSGHSFDVLREALVAFDGSADLVVCWEGGDSFDGLRLKDHTVTRHRVVMTLGEEVTE